MSLLVRRLYLEITERIAVGANMKSFIEDRVWERASQFIKDKYGKNIEFRFISEIDERDLFFVRGDDLVVSLKHKNESLGNVVVRHGSTLSQDQRQEAADLIQFLISPQAYSKFIQLKIESQTLPEKSENVINLFTHVKTEEESENEAPQLLSKFIHIKALSRVVRHKIAMKLHEMAGTIVLLRLQDILNPNQPIDMNMDLTDTALFIEDLTDLNAEQLKLLEKISKNSNVKNSLVLVGSSLDETALQALNCGADLKNDLIGMMYDADRVPASQQANEEVLELLFFNTQESLDS